MRKRVWIIIMAFILLLLAGTACGGDEETQVEESPGTVEEQYADGPVELLMIDRNSGFKEEELEILQAEVSAKYPEISIELVKGAMDNYITSGNIPDLALGSNFHFYLFTNIDYPEDLTEVVKRFEVDLDRYDPVVLNEMYRLGNDREGLFGLAFGVNYGATVYNKDIFDRFGVDYPTADVTWDDLIEYARRMTKEEDGIQYIGATPYGIRLMLNQAGVASMDPSGEKAIFNTDGHRELFSLLKTWFEIPNYVENDVHIYSVLEFFKEQRVGVVPYWTAGTLNQLIVQQPTFDWDITAVPTFKEDPKQGYPTDFHSVVVSQTSEHKEAAYRVAMTLISDELQMKFSKNGRISPLKSEEIRAAYGADAGILEGKNISDVFQVSPAPVPVYSKYAPDVWPYLNEIAKSIAVDQLDVNTAMREAEEAANQKIQEQKQ